MSSHPIASAPPVPVDHRPAVTVLSGFSPGAVHAAARALLIADERLIAVSHDLTGIRDGVLRRTVRSATELIEQSTVELAHGCVSCTLREDVLPTLVRLTGSHPGSDVLLVLPSAVEPEAVAAAGAHSVRFDSFITVVDPESFLDDLGSTADLHITEADHRSVAEVVVHQVEFCDTVILWSRPGTDSRDLDRVGALVHRLAPWAVQVPVGTTNSLDCTGLSQLVRRTGRHDPRRPGMLGLALEGRAIGIEGEDSVLFESRRPFHPQRLSDALEELAERALRGRGQLWIASQPDIVLAFESAGGGVSLGSLGYWLDALPVERWTGTSDDRRIAADLVWDPYYGDRRTALALIGLHLDQAAITGLLTRCLLTDAELADGFDSWRALTDPFAGIAD
ncbi:G3E family GTPase [Actinoplanes lutulentus]|uniref:G3E family GTPase n=1 Tax=Actinoplanes lutulentus TaxID=1287878 RepID=A0A327Z2V5_9ACTN|nr:GTP-binding protein [Actinoplanes lutulentus]MBB2948765.1 G3E family GTPase [Actinoplanes lutulentus]RAK29677.1 G3E family GTPase [Actinoplanes lutulentus]